MTGIIRPRVWTQQPQFAVGIDWSNPLTRGIQTYWIPSVPASGSAGYATNKNGIGVATDGTSQYRFKSCNWSYGSGVSLLAIADCNWRAPTTYERLVSVRTSTGSTGMQLYSTGTKAMQVFANSTLSTNGYTNFVLPSSAQTGVHVFASTTQFTLASHAAYVDGVALSGTTGGVENYSLQSGATGIDIGRLQYDSSNYFGRYNFIGLVIAWNRALSASEVKALSDNPYQIFRPRVT